MRLKIHLFFLLVVASFTSYAQKDTVKLKEVIISSNRIELPVSQNSRTITLINKSDLLNAASNNVNDYLQNISGVDIRRRGIDGMQADLYIRGGNFDQTLLLIDGVKMDDPQTGHHILNAMLPFEDIERIEVIKGPAARIFGQNAFTGAVNIITKKVEKNNFNVKLGYGSFNSKKGAINFAQKYKNGSTFAAVDFQKSDGYRYNTDFENVSTFLKSTFKNYNLVTFFNQRKFGANGFYASPAYKDQYEETQNSLVAISSNYKLGSSIIKPRIYYRRNQDMYLFLRNDPTYYRNLHISNKVGAETNVELNSKYGKTGIGIDVARVSLVSNNLGNHQRTTITGFLEQRFSFLNEKLDITPGFAINYFSDFKSKIFPGIDLGYKISDIIKVYSNLGYTYRVPTYTDLYYVGPTTIGNPNLQPESALAEEIGLKINTNFVKWDVVFFNRKSTNLIDWAKNNDADKWQTRNFSEVSTQGIETNFSHQFVIKNYLQQLQLSYSYINDKIYDVNVPFTLYSLNSMKHKFVANVTTKFFPNVSQTITYRYAYRTDGSHYSVVDAKILATIKSKLQLSLIANNIFNAAYTETNLVPMPKGNVMLGLNYNLY